MARRGLTKQAEIDAAINGTEISRPNNEEIAQRAFDIYEREGRIEGRDMDHWLRAEAELIRERENGRSNAGSPERSQDIQESGRGNGNDQRTSTATPRRGLNREKAIV